MTAPLAPVAVPRVAVRVGGSALPGDALRALLGVVVRRACDVPAQCELRFDATDAAARDALAVSVGVAFSVDVDEIAMFDGELTAATWSADEAGRRTLDWRGYDPLHRLRKRQGHRTLTDVTVADVAREFVTVDGLDVAADATGPTWPRVLQTGASDFELLAELARRSGVRFCVDGGRLHLFDASGRADVPAPPRLRLARELRSVTVEANADRAARSVRAVAWDAARAELFEATATSPTLARDAFAVALGADEVAPLARPWLAPGAVLDAVAQADLDARAAHEVTLDGVAFGEHAAALAPGGRVEIADVEPDVDGTYVLARVTHKVTPRAGYVVEFSTRPAPPPDPPPAPRQELTPAAVIDVDDPDGLGRVRVALPLYGGVETGWCPALGAGVGAGKGLVAGPDVGDCVLVALDAGAGGQAVVLGGLWGTGEPHSPAVDGGRVRRFAFRTPAGHALVADEVAETLRLTHANGSLVEFAPRLTRLHSAVALEVAAPGQPIRIVAKAVDFVQE